MGALNKLGERYHACGKHLTLELLHPNNSKVIDKAQKLLVKEIGVEIDGALALPMVSEPHRIEGLGVTNTFMLSRGADAAAALSVAIRRTGRLSTVLGAICDPGGNTVQNLAKFGLGNGTCRFAGLELTVTVRAVLRACVTLAFPTPVLTRAVRNN